MLYIIGLGLGDEKDITLRGLEAVKRCHKVYIEAYTSLLSFGLSSNGLSTLVTTKFSSSSVSLFVIFFGIKDDQLILTVNECMIFSGFSLFLNFVS